ncbi:MAG: glucosyltransferase [Clostridiales bacterium]|nr:glucosyltransferase [Clostridiales bacterium]
MKIVWFCIPAHGHTNPTLGVVKELTNAGHEVYYFSFEMLREKIERAGAVFISCDGFDFDIRDKNAADRVGKDIAFATELLVKATLALDEMISEKVKEIKPDLIVSDSIAYWGKLTAMKYGIPYVSSTTTFAFNRYSSRYLKRGAGEIIKMIFTMPKINKYLQLLRDNGYPVKNIYDIVSNDNETNTIVYTSKEFQPCSETFSDRYRFIGPSIRPIESEMKKTAAKTVYISMGTVMKNKEIYVNCIKALGNTDYQVIISLGDNSVEIEDIPENIGIYKSVDQMAVLSIADVFLTHCGMNSVSEALYYEVPLVMLPQTPEQGAVAKRAEELNAGVFLKNTGESAIISAIETILSNAEYKSAAKKISESFKRCGGVFAAREFLEKIYRGD